MFFIYEQVKETISDFLHGTAKNLLTFSRKFVFSDTILIK